MSLVFMGKMPDEEYFAYDAVNASSLKEFKKSPAHYKTYLEKPAVYKDAFRIGSVAHARILEKKVCKNILPADFNGRTKAGKELKASFGKDHLTISEATDIERMFSAVESHSIGRKIINPDWAEIVVIVDDPETGLRLKAKFDCLPDKGNVVFDLKTCQSAAEAKFKWTMRDFGYSVQASHYLNVANLAGLEMSNFLFIAVEKEAPFGVQCFSLSDDAQEKSDDAYFAMLKDFAECKKSDDFSVCYSEEIAYLDIF